VYSVLKAGDQVVQLLEQSLVKDWHRKLPPEIQDMLSMDGQDADEFTAPVLRMEALSRLTFRRAIEAVADDEADPDLIASDEEDAPLFESPQDKLAKEQWREKRVEGRLDLTARIHKELVKAKWLRLEAKDRFEKLDDTPKPANLHFNVAAPTPQQIVQRLLNMGDYLGARKQAEVHRISHEFDWSGKE
jgi:hypothetical protein